MCWVTESKDEQNWRKVDNVLKMLRRAVHHVHDSIYGNKKKMDRNGKLISILDMTYIFFQDE